MDPDEFKRSLDKYWYDSLTSIDTQFWPAIGRTIRNADGSDTKLARGLAKKYARILQEVGKLDSSYMPLVVDALESVSSNAESCNKLGEEAARILKKTGKDGFVQIARATKALKSAMTSYGLLKISPDLIKKHGSEYYASITDAMLKAEEKDYLVSRDILKGYADRLQQGDAEEFIMVCGRVAEIAAKDARTGINLASKSQEFIQKNGIEKYAELVTLVKEFIPLNKEASAQIAYQGAYALSADLGTHKDRILQAAKVMAKHDHNAVVPLIHDSAGIIQSIGIDKYDEFIEILKDSWDLAHCLLYSADELIPLVGLDGFKQVAEATHDISQGIWQTRKYLAPQAARIVKTAGLDGYKKVANTLSELEDAAWFAVVIELASHSGSLVETSGVDGFKRVCTTMKNIEPLFPQNVIPSYADSLKGLSLENKDYPTIIVRAAEELSKADANKTFNFIAKCKELIHTPDQKDALDPYLLLIQSIHDQNDAQVIGKLIDKTKYGKPYAQKCGGFY